MKVFHELAFEGYLQSDGAAVAYTSDPRLLEIMGAVDVLHVSGYAAQTSGASPQLNISVASSNDLASWTFRGVIIALSLSTSVETFFQGVGGDPTNQRFGYTALLLQLQGTSARTFLRVWVTGRDRSRRSAAMVRAQTSPPPQREGLPATAAALKPAPQMPRNSYGSRG